MKPISERRWNLAKQDDALVADVARQSSVEPLLARLLVARGVTEPNHVRCFLTPSLSDLHDPFLLRDMDRAVSRLQAAIFEGQKICVYGDYDVDGVTATVVLVEFLRSLGADCFYHIPRRLEEGYGLSRAGISLVAGQGARIIITADCGISARDEAQLCASLGIDLIITDHHTPPENLPVACAVINPLRHDCRFPCKALAGVGVAFNLVIALRMALRDAGFFTARPEPNLRQYLDLVALGTIADIVPIVDENRILVSHGLCELTTGERLGVAALKEVAAIRGVVDCGAVGFRLAPRINAAGRLEDAAMGVELLLTSDRQRAADLAAALDASNEERQAVEQAIIREAVAQISENPSMAGKTSIVLASATWHAGVIGIVASRIVDLFHRPTILFSLAEGNGKGSGRSIPGFHLYDALQACSEHLLRFGGHKYAAGMTIAESTLTAFASSFDEIAAGTLTEDDLTPELRIDAELQPEEVTLAAAELVALLQPFGMGNPRPVFVMRRVAVRQRTVLKERHVRLRLAAGAASFEALGFNMLDVVPDAAYLDVAFTLEVNVWQNRKSLQLRLKDCKESFAGVP